MNDEIETQKGNKKRTITMALDDLNNKDHMLGELVDLTETLLSKLFKTDQEPPGKKDVSLTPHENLAEAFFGVSESMDKKINEIGSNINRAINIIS